VQYARAAGNRTHCANNLSGIGKAYNMYLDARGLNPFAFKGDATWMQQLANNIENRADAFICTSDDTGGPSYGVSPQAQYFKKSGDSGKVLVTEYLAVDFGSVVLDVFGVNRDNWLGNLSATPPKLPRCAPRHQGLLNVLFRDGHVENKQPFEIDPANNQIYRDYWRPIEPGPGA